MWSHSWQARWYLCSLSCLLGRGQLKLSALNWSKWFWCGLSCFLGGVDAFIWFTNCNSIFLAHAGLLVWGSSYPSGSRFALCEWTWKVSTAVGPFHYITITISIWYHITIFIHFSCTPKPFRLYIGARIVLHILVLEGKYTWATKGIIRRSKRIAALRSSSTFHFHFASHPPISAIFWPPKLLHGVVSYFPICQCGNEEEYGASDHIHLF